LIHGSHKDSLDFVTCDPKKSRFGLYGSPDTGQLCKYAKVTMAKDMDDSTPYINGVLKVVIENNLSSGQSVSEVVFPIIENSVYYNDSKAKMDGINVKLRKRAVVNISDVKVDSISTDWKKSPSYEETIQTGAMEAGLE
jgi:hypothetical protein